MEPVLRRSLFRIMQQVVICVQNAECRCGAEQRTAVSPVHKEHVLGRGKW